MKRVALATALACMAMGASAADVSVYGRVDTGLLYTDDGDTQTLEMNSGGAGASRWGIKGSENLGDGYKVGFQLEQKIGSDTGALGTAGKMFDRDAYIYVNSPYGDVRFGRSGALGGGVSGGMFAGKTSPFGVVYGNAASTKVYAVETRHDNMVRYDTPRMGGLKFAAAYSFGTDTDDAKGEGENNRYAAVGADYKAGDLNVVAVADVKMFADESVKDTQSYKLAVNYKLDPVTLYAGYQYSKDAQKLGGKNLKGSDTDSMTLGARVKAAGGDVNFVVGYAQGENEKTEMTIKQVALGYTYKLSKAVTLYTVASFLDIESETLASGKKTSEETTQVMAGMYYAF